MSAAAAVPRVRHEIRAYPGRTRFGGSGTRAYRADRVSTAAVRGKAPRRSRGADARSHDDLVTVRAACGRDLRIKTRALGRDTRVPRSRQARRAVALRNLDAYHLERALHGIAGVLVHGSVAVVVDGVAAALARPAVYIRTAVVAVGASAHARGIAVPVAVEHGVRAHPRGWVAVLVDRARLGIGAVEVASARPTGGAIRNGVAALAYGARRGREYVSTGPSRDRARVGRAADRVSALGVARAAWRSSVMTVPAVDSGPRVGRRTGAAAAAGCHERQGREAHEEARARTRRARRPRACGRL